MIYKEQAGVYGLLLVLLYELVCSVFAYGLAFGPPVCASGKSTSCLSARLLNRFTGQADAEFLGYLSVDFAGYVYLSI